MGRSISERLYTNPEHSFRGRNKYTPTDEQVKDLDPKQELYSISGEAPEGYYNAGSKKVYVKGGGYKDHQIFKKLPENEKPAEEPVAEEPTEEVRDDKGFTDPNNLAVSPEMQQARERVQAWNAHGGVGDPKPFAERGLMDRIGTFFK